jgi:hypothetical protein
MDGKTLLLLRNVVIFLVGLYLFSQDATHEMLFGFGMMLYGAIGHAIDSLAIYLSEAVETDLKDRIDKLETKVDELNVGQRQTLEFVRMVFRIFEKKPKS